MMDESPKNPHVAGYLDLFHEQEDGKIEVNIPPALLPLFVALKAGHREKYILAPDPWLSVVVVKTQRPEPKRPSAED
jgi:hypothetical protein